MARIQSLSVPVDRKNTENILGNFYRKMPLVNHIDQVLIGRNMHANLEMTSCMLHNTDLCQEHFEIAIICQDGFWPRKQYYL